MASSLEHLNRPATRYAPLASCAGCGAAMIRNSGKGGTYLYYACSRAMKQGKTACRG